jgi:hypothetical protein
MKRSEADSLNNDPFGGGNRVFGARVPFHGVAEGAGGGFEDSLAPVMDAPAAKNVDVQREGGMIHNPLPKIFAEIVGGQSRLENEVWTAAEIKRNAGKGLVHRIETAPHAANPPAFPQRLSQCLPQNDAGILDKVMVVHLGVAPRGQVDVKKPVLRKQSKHVGVKTRWIVDLRNTRPVKVETKPNRRLRRFPFNHRAPRHYYLLKSAVRNVALTVSIQNQPIIEQTAKIMKREVSPGRKTWSQMNITLIFPDNLGAFSAAPKTQALRGVPSLARFDAPQRGG